MKEIKYLIAHKSLLALFILIFILTLLPSFTDGSKICIGHECSLLVRDINDGMWFDAISVVAFRTFPFQMPNFAGGIMSGYHFLPNLLASIIHNITNIPVYLIRLRFFPLLYLSAITILSIKVARKIHNDSRFVFLFCMFLLLGAPFRILTAMYNLNLSEFWNRFMINTFDATNIMVSPQTAFSQVFLFLLISNLLTSKVTFKTIIMNCVILFLLFGTKFYTAIIAVIIFTVFMLSRDIKREKLKMLAASMFSLGVVLCTSYLVFFKTSTTSHNSLFLFSPYSLVHHMIEVPHRFFYSNDLTLQRYFLYSHANGFSLRLLLIELYSSILFIFFYLGLRSIGLVYLFFRIKDVLKDPLWRSLVFAAIPSVIFPILFIQRGTWFDTAQFFVGGSFLLGILSAQFLYIIMKTYHKFRVVVFVIVILICLQNTASAIHEFTTTKQVISYEELMALDVLKKAPSGTIFYPITSNDSPYVNAFSEKQSYLNYIHVLKNMGSDFQERERIVKNADIERLADAHVRYLYIPRLYKPYLKAYYRKLTHNIKRSVRYKKMYSNKNVDIYELRKL